MDIVWDDLTIDVGDKPVVRRLSGAARSGRMIAVMGPTGSGKTTLLTNLAARGAGTYKVGGTVRYGGHEWSKALKRRTGFVEQEDLASAELTVRQNLNVAAQLRLPQQLLGRETAGSGQAHSEGWLLINRRLQRVEEKFSKQLDRQSKSHQVNSFPPRLALPRPALSPLQPSPPLPTPTGRGQTAGAEQQHAAFEALC